MKVALVHDWLNQKNGGAESVLFKLARIYPEADIFTLVYNKKKFAGYLEGHKIVTSRLQLRPRFVKRNPALMLGGIKKSVEAWDFSGYDVVISSSTAWVKNICVPKGVKHICYCHSPARMMWDSWPGYLDKIKLGPLQLGATGRFLVTTKVSKLRLWDYYGSAGVSEFIANSAYVAGRIQKYYHRTSTVVYPLVKVRQLKPELPVKKQDYYLVLSVLAAYKQIDIAVRAFKKSGLPLIVAGDGPDMERLKRLAQNHANITFLGRVSPKQKKQLLQEARGFVFCSLEDFGITIAEAVAAGTGVIALRGGGAEEILHEGKSGWFFDKATPEALQATIDQYEKAFTKQTPNDFAYIYKEFGTEVFETQIRKVVGE